MWNKSLGGKNIVARGEKISLAMQTQVEAPFKFQGDWIIKHVMQLQ